MFRCLTLLTLLLLQGCAVYHFERSTAAGDHVHLSIYSTREVKAGELNIDKNGALKGNAAQLGSNERLVETLNTAIQKIP